MALEIVKNINIDFYDSKYTMVNAKQYDDVSRWIAITCYNQGSLFNISASKHSAYVKYRKADGYGVLNYCRINNKGEILVELTEQMLAADGICYVDLVVVNKGSVMVNVDTGEIITIDDSPILSTMAFCVNVYETTVDNSEIESSYEYDALNEMLKKAEADYTEVMKLSKSYAVGNAGGIRDGEDSDNAKYYCEEAAGYAEQTATNASDAAESARQVAESVSNIENIINGLETGFIPMGTISFSELATAAKATGYVYNINEDFITDETFREGAGKSYTAGTNVYYTNDGLWDCFGGSASSAATVDEVKSYLGI